MKCHRVFSRRLGTSIQGGILLACAVLSSGLGTSDAASAQETAAPAKIRKILFLGNSITRHGPAPAIGWLGDWGMAASAEEKDFVHLVTASVAKTTGTRPEIMVRNIADFERGYAAYDVAEKLKEPFAFNADLVIVAIGENVSRLDSDQAKAQFKDALTRLLSGVKADRHPMLLVRSCFWPDQAKDQALKQACQEAGGIFVDIGRLALDPSNYARSERQFKHSGVAGHPGDKGMQAIASAILEAIGAQRAEGKR